MEFSFLKTLYASTVQLRRVPEADFAFFLQTVRVLPAYLGNRTR